MFVTIKQSKIRRQSIVIQTMLGQCIAQGTKLQPAADSLTKHVMLMSYLDACRRFVAANEAGDQPEADAAFGSMSRIFKETNLKK